MLWNFRKTIVLFALALVVFFSCREDFEFDTANGGLVFSADTVQLDTVFSQSKSETFAVRIYNNSNSDLNIPSIFLDRGETSFYNLNVNGVPGKSFENVAIRAEDSLFVFLEIEVEDVANHQLYEDEIVINQGNSNERVRLISFIENAEYYIAPEGGEVSITDLTWDESASRVIFGSAVVNNNLTITPGTRVYFADNSGMRITSGNELNINGELNRRVIFRGTRHTARYDSLPEVWNKVVLEENASANINYLRLQNSKGGLEILENADAQIRNSEFYNNQDFGIYAVGAKIMAENLILSNSNISSLAIDKGGEYTFNHCTFANYFRFDVGPRYSVFLSNSFVDDSGNRSLGDLNANFGNCIIYGQAQSRNSLFLDQEAGAAFNYEFNTCIIRNETTSALDFSADPNVVNSIFEDPEFLDTTSDDGFNFRLSDDSPARGLGIFVDPYLTPTDFFGIERITNGTLGAIQ